MEELQQEQMPQNAEQPPMPQEPLNEYDTTSENAELEGIAKEMKDIEASIEGDFAKYISDLVDNDSVFEELFFSDRNAFFKKVIEEQNKFVSSIIEPRMQRAEELQGVIAQKNELASLESIKQEFQQAHPEVDIKELIRFFAEELSPRVQEEIKAQPLEQFFYLIYEIYQGMQNQAQAQDNPPMPQEEAQEELPKQVQGVAVDSEQSNTNAYLPMGRN